MGKHGHDDGHRYHYGGSDDYGSRTTSGSAEYGTYARRPRQKLLLAVALTGLALWSLFAWASYGLVDPVLGWTAAIAGPVVDSGKDLAAPIVGKEVASVVAGLNISGFVQQTISVLRVTLKPVIVVVWAVGALVLVVTPIIWPRVRKLLAARSH